MSQSLRMSNACPMNVFFRDSACLYGEAFPRHLGHMPDLKRNRLHFATSTYAVSLDHLPSWQATVILGTLLSSLGRFWLYMVSGSWGTWRDEVRSRDLLNLPLRLPSDPNHATKQIEEAVEDLRHQIPKLRSSVIPTQMEQIDQGVDELFELRDAERYLVADFWAGLGPVIKLHVPLDVEVGGTEDDLDLDSREGMWPYLRVFLKTWNQRLGGQGHFSWKVWHDSRTGVIAVVLETRELGIAGNPTDSSEDSESWSAALSRIGVQWQSAQTQSILRYGLVRAVTETAVVVVKRDEQHLWTTTTAWQDADATAAQLMSLAQ